MLTHEELMKKILSNPEVQDEYDSLQDEFSLFDELLKARTLAGLTKSDVANLMGTKKLQLQDLRMVGETNITHPQYQP